MIATMQSLVIDCPDPAALAGFYQSILGWELDDSDAPWVVLSDTATGRRIAFQYAPDHQPPRWPDPGHPQQMHLDFDVAEREDVERARTQVEALGARFLHDSGGDQRGFVVFEDPAGHPFCLCYGQWS
ncbi:VOC family protein [Streptomyces carpaticus]|uniref:VOC family protein n=1 Tax=Streptomyces carpaticus TaxID=285558 RepID=A0ABV4ZT89_9ACTN